MGLWTLKREFLNAYTIWNRIMAAQFSPLQGDDIQHNIRKIFWLHEVKMWFGERICRGH